MDSTKKDILYHKTLEMIPFDGCTQEALINATKALNIPEEYARIHFQLGIDELIEHHLATLLETATAQCEALPSISKTITSFVTHYINELQHNRRLNRPIIAYLCAPKNVSSTSRHIWNIVNTAWYLTPDRAVNFSFYTKRLTLVGVLSSTLLYWLSDTSEDAKDTHLFFKRRMQDVANVHSFKNNCKNYVKKPFKFSF